MSYPASLRIMWPIWIFIFVMSSGHPSEPASTDTGSDQSPKALPITSRIFQSLYLPKYLWWRFFRSAYLLLLLIKMKLHCFCKSGKKKKAWQNTGAINTYTSSGLAHYLLCGDSLSTNFLFMKADCYYTSTNGTFDFDNALCIRVCIEQPLISAAWTSYMYFFLHDSTLQSHTVIIWRAKSTIHFCSDWDFYFCLFLCRKDSASSKLNSTAIQ